MNPPVSFPAGAEHIPPLAPAGFTLLLVEDNPDDRVLLELLLDEAGITVDRIEFAGSVADAVAMAGRHPPGLILLDLNLPDSTGLHTLTRVRAAIPGVPVVVMTGRDEERLAFLALKEGAQDFLVKGRVDAWTLTRTLRYAIERHELVMALEAAHATASHQATHDSLTGLPNRALFDDRIAHALSRATRRKSRLAVVFLDLDNFKPVNDQWGHSAGDMVLIEIARRLDSLIRGSDTVARIGGDEFGVLFEDLPDTGTAVTLAETMRTQLSQPIILSSGACSVGVSLGLAFFPDEDHDAAGLMRRADARMYADKEQRHRQ